ncbi:YegP family protein [Arthrobacter sp. NA-172]|uniref:YegP family protein n=1 Tax=Arthrobacter sp. NA-172 TaxID=3367524 RepID=UPI0037552FFC
MAGTFEVFVDEESRYRFRLKSPDGSVIAISTAFEDKSAAVAGIAAARECAGMGLVTDLCPAASVRNPAPVARPNVLPPVCDDRHRASDGFRTRARELRRAAAAPRWTGAA